MQQSNPQLPPSSVKDSTKSSNRAKHWCFTINNYKPDEILPKPSDYSYMVLGDEIAKSGTPHYQGYVCFHKQLSFATVKKLLPGAHLEVMRSTPKQASDYCKKDGKFTEYGTLPVYKNTDTGAALKKRKADYELAYELAKKQQLYKIDRGMLIRYGSSLKMIQKDHPAQMDDNDYLCGVWLYGPPGVGKSRSARWLYSKAYPKPLNKWWDGYQGEDFVLMDDIEPVHHVLGHHIKQWADHYPFTAEQKGTSVRIRPKIICITSNYTIEEIWSGVMGDAIRRRFVVINCEQKLLRTAKKPLYCPPRWAEDSQDNEQFDKPPVLNSPVFNSPDLYSLKDSMELD